MHVSRIGFTPLKGTRHRDQPYADLTLHGPVGDRVLCLVDRARGRVVRTVEHPTLMRTIARWHDGVLTTELPGGTLEGSPGPTGELLEVDYWGTTVRLEVLDGPWAAAFAEEVGHEVVLTRAVRPGDLVYGAPVSLVSSSSLDRLAAETGEQVDAAQLRMTFTVDTTGHPDHVEDTWIGRRVTIGEAEVEVRSAVPRCAVVDLDPVTGTRRSHVLAALGRYRRAHGEVVFGVDAVVTRPGRVHVDAVVEGD